jgi:hypothetical protein
VEGAKKESLCAARLTGRACSVFNFRRVIKSFAMASLVGIEPWISNTWVTLESDAHSLSDFS